MKEDLKYETESMKTANDSAIYVWLIVGVVVGLFGAFFRFVHDSFTISLISWIFLFIGAGIAIRSVFKILNA
ncbi:F0F1-type ATP synthase assembly protein I [Pedobacter sp. UYEF25]